MDRGARQAPWGSQRVIHDLVTKQQSIWVGEGWVPLPASIICVFFPHVSIIEVIPSL